MIEGVNEIFEKYADKLSALEIQNMINKYQDMVKDKISILFDTIKLNSGNGCRAIEITEACMWIDAVQNLLVNLVTMLKQLETDENKKTTYRFLEKIISNLQELNNEGK